MNKKYFIRSFLSFGIGVGLCASLPTPVALGADNETDLTALKDLAETEDGDALFKLARHYFRGIGVEMDQEKGIALLRSAAAAGHAEAMSTLGYFHLTGEGLSKDPAAAVDWFRQGAEAGSPLAQYNYGALLRKGEGVEKSSEEGLIWLERAAANGRIEASTTLGQLYFLGDADVRKDADKAFPHLLKSAEAGDVTSQNMLGLCYRRASGTDRDDAAAEKWLRVAAGQNYAKAQANLAKQLGVDSPDSPTREEGLMWLLIAVNQAEITAKKTFDELLPSFPAEMLTRARQQADEFSRQQLQKRDQGPK